jgi:futalosine hydrolase
VTSLAVLATAAECDAAHRQLDGRRDRLGPYDVVRTPTAVLVVSGIGPAPAAAATATALSLERFDGVVSLGICGGFRGAAEIGDVVVATDLVAADVGADSPEGFLDLDALGWAEQLRHVEPDRVQRTADLLRASGLPVVTGPVVTVSTVTGTQQRADELAARHGAVAEAMEGRGVADAAEPHGVPVLEVRTVSNLVGRRDPSAWRFDVALDALARAAAVLLGEELRW